MINKFTIPVSDLRKVFWKWPEHGSQNKFPGPPPWLYELIGDRFYTFDLPTEFVIYPEGEAHRLKWNDPIHPRTGRIFQTSCYLYNGELMGWQEVYKKAGLADKVSWSAADIRDQIALVEVWEDEGDDGHVDYVWNGWVAIPEKELELRRSDKPYSEAMHRRISKRIQEEEERLEKEKEK